MKGRRNFVFTNSWYTICFQSHHGYYSMEVLLLLGFDGCNMLLAISIACEFGQQMRNAFSEINDLIDQFHWYRFPVDMKRTLPIALIIVQKPVSIEFFGSFSCCRELFRKVQRLNRTFISELLNYLDLICFSFWKAYSHILWYFVNSSNEVSQSKSKYLNSEGSNLYRLVSRLWAIGKR